MLPLRYLAGYPDDLQRQVRAAIAEDQLAAMLRTRYPGTHEVRSDGALYDYTPVSYTHRSANAWVASVSTSGSAKGGLDIMKRPAPSSRTTP